MRSRSKVLVAGLLIGLLVLAVSALAGIGAANPGKGKANGLRANGNHPGRNHSASASQYQYGPAGKQYGRHRVAVCHKGRTIHIAMPAVKAHLDHGDTLGACTS